MKNLTDIIILFVDDELETLSALNRFLRREPYRKVFADSGAKALEHMENGGADIIISDVHMPSMSGLELIRVVKERYPGTICLLNSGANEIDQIVKSIEADSIFGFITKPIEPETFKQSIHDAIDFFFRENP